MGTKFQKFLSDVCGKNVAVIGMGVSNTPLIRLLLSAGANVTIRDKKERNELGEAVDIFEREGAKFILGENYLEDITEEVVFKTPGLRPDVPQLELARKRGATVTSEMEIFFKVCPAKTIGITGSDGKTTTTTIIYELLSAAGHKCYVGGNIGTPLLDRVPEMNETDICVLELSSFQLMTMDESPDISVITNITPNHLDMHKSMDEYVDAKRNIMRFQNGGRLVLNLDNEITRKMADERDDAVMFSRRAICDFCLKDDTIWGVDAILPISEIKIPGLHNVENYLAAIAAVDGLVPYDVIRNVARSFNGVAHRMELVREKDGVSYYNDSIASSPTRTIAGLRAFKQKVILIAGGYDKKIPFDVLGPAVMEHVKALILTGATANKIEDAVRKTPGFEKACIPIYNIESFDDAVRMAHEIAERGDIVTLSPACASFDKFKNFAERGNHFRDLVNSL